MGFTPTQPKSTSWFFVTHLYNSHTNTPSTCPLHDITFSPNDKAQPSRSPSVANTLFQEKLTDRLSSFFAHYSALYQTTNRKCQKAIRVIMTSTSLLLSHLPFKLSPSNPEHDLYHALCWISAWFLPLELFATFTFVSVSLHKAQCREMGFYSSLRIRDQDMRCEM